MTIFQAFKNYTRANTSSVVLLVAKVC